MLGISFSFSAVIAFFFYRNGAYTHEFLCLVDLVCSPPPSGWCAEGPWGSLLCDLSFALNAVSSIPSSLKTIWIHSFLLSFYRFYPHSSLSFHSFFFTFLFISFSFGCEKTVHRRTVNLKSPVFHLLCSTLKERERLKARNLTSVNLSVAKSDAARDCNCRWEVVSKLGGRRTERWRSHVTWT